MSTSATNRSWRDAVLDAMTRQAEAQAGNVIDRQRLVSEEHDRIVTETESQGATPDQTLSRILQELRNEDLIKFLGGGKYELPYSAVDGARPVCAS